MKIITEKEAARIIHKAADDFNRDDIFIISEVNKDGTKSYKCTLSEGEREIKRAKEIAYESNISFASLNLYNKRIIELKAGYDFIKCIMFPVRYKKLE